MLREEYRARRHLARRGARKLAGEPGDVRFRRLRPCRTVQRYELGRRLFDRYRSAFHIKPGTIERGERLFASYGAITIFFARFIFGLRVIAGPLAGVLRMPWKRFALFNFLGALLWVTVISFVGYKFGKHWDVLTDYVERFNLAIAVVIIVGVLAAWLWRRRRNPT